MKIKNIALKARIHADGMYIIALRGRCMEPFIMEGDTAMVVPVSDYVVGDLYLFELADGELALHRLIEASANCIFMKGDRSKGCEKVSYKDILGVVKAVRFKNSNDWIELRKHKVWNKICTFLSKKSVIFDKTEYGCRYKKWIKNCYIIIIFSYSFCFRWTCKIYKKLCI